MKSKLTNNLGLKILALVVSFIIWFVVINISDPVDRTVFRNIPVEIQNVKMLTKEGKVYEVVDGTDVIDVTVWAQRTILDTLSKDNIIAVADMADLNLANNQIRIKVSSNRNNDRLDSIQSSEENLLLNIENLKSRQLVVETATIGEPAEGYILGTVSTEQNLVRISGAESKIAKVSSAIASVDVTGLSQNVRTGSTIRLMDAEGNIIEDEGISQSIDQVNASIEILQTKRVPINYQVMGNPSDGYVFTGEIESNPGTIEVASIPSIIRNLEAIDVPESAINLTGQSGDMSVHINIKEYLPQGVVLADPDFSGSITATAKIEQLVTKNIVLEPDEIVLNNVPEGYLATVDEETAFEVPVTGIASEIAGMDTKSVVGQIDVGKYLEESSEEITEGVYHVPVSITLPENFTTSRSIFADVTIEKE